MNYIKDGQYPVSEQAIRDTHPNSSIPRPMLPQHVAELGYLPVEETAQPVFDPQTQVCEEAAPVLDNGAWIQAWIVRAMTQPEADAAAAQAAAIAERNARGQLVLEARATAMFAALEGASLAQINTWVDNNFSGFTAQQRAFLKLLAAGVGAFLRER